MSYAIKIARDAEFCCRIRLGLNISQQQCRKKGSLPVSLAFLSNFIRKHLMVCLFSRRVPRVLLRAAPKWRRAKALSSCRTRMGAV